MKLKRNLKNILCPLSFSALLLFTHFYTHMFFQIVLGVLLTLQTRSFLQNKIKIVRYVS